MTYMNRKVKVIMKEDKTYEGIIFEDDPTGIYLRGTWRSVMEQTPSEHVVFIPWTSIHMLVLA